MPVAVSVQISFSDEYIAVVETRSYLGMVILQFKRRVKKEKKSV